MDQQLTAQRARTVGHISWWVFVVASLYAGGVYWWDSYRGIGTAGMGHSGWSAYIPFVPLTDSGDNEGAPGTVWTPVFASGWHNPGIYSLVAFIVVVLAAIIEAVSIRRLGTGMVTVMVPFVSLGLFVLATPQSTVRIQMDTIVAMLITLAAIAIRETWARVLLPRIESGG